MKNRHLEAYAKRRKVTVQWVLRSNHVRRLIETALLEEMSRKAIRIDAEGFERIKSVALKAIFPRPVDYVALSGITVKIK